MYEDTSKIFLEIQSMKARAWWKQNRMGGKIKC